MIHSPSQVCLVKPTLDPESRTASGNGRGVDCRGFSRAMAICHLGAHDRTTADETINFTVEESGDDGAGDAYVAVTGAATGVIGAVTPNATSGDIWLIDIDLTKRERWLRGVVTLAGTSPIDLCSMAFVLFNPHQGGPTQDKTVAEA